MKPKSNTSTLRLVNYRCDICDLLTEKLQEYRQATIFGRPMRLCVSCVSFLNHKKSREELAAQISFGIDLNLSAGDGLKRVAEMEQAFEVEHKGKVGEEIELDRQALCRLRFYFENKTASGN